MIEIIISALSLILVIIISVLLFVNANKVRDDLNKSMNSIVDQVNNNQYYIYKFDKKQDDQIQNISSDFQILKQYIDNNFVKKEK